MPCHWWKLVTKFTCENQHMLIRACIITARILERASKVFIMFECFILIVGLSTRSKKTSPEGFQQVGPQFCITCQHLHPPAFYRNDTWFSFFFIPLFRVKKGKRIEVRCSNCNGPMAIYPPVYYPPQTESCGPAWPGTNTGLSDGEHHKAACI